MTRNRSFQMNIGLDELNFNEDHFARTPDELLSDRGSRIENELEELNAYVRVVSNLKEKVITPIQDIILSTDTDSPGIRCVKRICSHLIVIEEMVIKLYNYSTLYFNSSQYDPQKTFNSSQYDAHKTYDPHRTFNNSASCLNAIIKAWEEYLVAYAEADAFQAFEEVIKLRGAKAVIDRGYEEFSELCNTVSFDVSGHKNGRSTRVLSLKLSCLLLLTHEERASIVVLSNEFLLSLDTQTERVETTEFKLICDKLARLTERNRQLQNQVTGTRKFWLENPKLLNCLEVRDNKKLIILSSKEKKLTYLKWSSHSIGFVLFPDSLLKFTIDMLGNYEARILPLKLLWVYASRSRPEARLQMQIIAPEVNITLLCGSEEDRDNWVRAINEATIDHMGAPRQENRKADVSTSNLLWPPQLRKSTYIFTSGLYQSAKYTGQWLEGKPHGVGKMIWPDGRFYMGDFRKGLFNGKGKYSMTQNQEDGTMDIYEGHFEEGLFNGFGVLSYGNEDRYEGEWVKGQRHGHGKFYLTHDNNYSVYIGEWANGKRSGFGVENSTEAEKSYHGMWREDIREGPGLTITTRDEYCACRFRDNQLSGRGFIINGKGKSYDGWLSGVMSLNGSGEIRLSDNTYISGTFSGKWNEWEYLGSELKIINGFISRSASKKKSTGFTEIEWEDKSLKYAATSDVKWCSLFDTCKKSLHLVEKDPASPSRSLRYEQGSTRKRVGPPRSQSLQPDVRTSSISKEHSMKQPPYTTYSVLPSDGIVDASKGCFDISIGPVCMPPEQQDPVKPDPGKEERKKRLLLNLGINQKDRVRSSSNPEPYSFIPRISPNGKLLTRRASEMIRLDSLEASNGSVSISPKRTTPDLDSTLTSTNTTPSRSTTPSNFSPSLYNSHSMNLSLESSSVTASPLEGAEEDINTSLDYSEFTTCQIAVQQIKKNLFDQLNTYCSSTKHPLGKLVRDLKDVIFESYAGIGASQYLLPHAIQDTKVFLAKLADIVQKYAPFMIDEKAQLYGMIPKQVIEENSHFIDSYFISDLFLPRIYHTLFTLFSLLQEYNDSQYGIVVAILSRMNCTDLMELFSIGTPYPSDPYWYREASQILSAISQEYTIEGKLTILQSSVNTMLGKLKDCTTELCTDVIIPYFHIVIIYARVKKLSTELHYIYTFMDPRLSQGEFGFLLTLLEGCYMMLSPDKLPCCL